MEYNYPEDIKLALLIMPELKGALILGIRINIVVPEFNVVYLNTDRGVFAIQGHVGGEYLGIVKLDTFPEITYQDGYEVREYVPFQEFVGKIISQIRQVGEAWNGHGLELSFEGEFNRTMIVQSIYAGNRPDQYEDCLRLGIGVYQYCIE